MIDDEGHYRSALRRALELEGHRVLEAADGEAGLRRITTDGADAVLLDIFMPGKEGIETLREIRLRWPRLPVIAMSGGGELGHLDILRAARALGARETLRKPFDNEAVSALLGRVLGTS